MRAPIDNSLSVFANAIRAFLRLEPLYQDGSSLNKKEEKGARFSIHDADEGNRWIRSHRSQY